MSTQVLASQIDRPPLGTPCIVCKRLGHWCPAHRYIGSTDDGICNPCAESEDCPQVKARSKTLVDEDVFTPTLPAPVKKIDPAAEKKQIPGKCSIFNCGHKAAPNGTFCSERHYAELVEERKRTHWAKETRSDGKPKSPPDPAAVSAAISAGMKRAKSEGTRIGRPAANEVAPEEIGRLRAQGKSYPEIAKTVGLGLSTVKRKAPKEAPEPSRGSAPEVTMQEKREAVSILDKPKAAALESPRASRCSYDEVIADLEEKLAVIQQTIATLKIMRG